MLKLPLKLYERQQNTSTKQPISSAAKANTKTFIWSKPATQHTPYMTETWRVQVIPGVLQAGDNSIL